MDYVLIFFGVLFIVGGIAGGVLPIVPGPPLSYLGLLMLHFTERYHFSTGFLILWAIITAFVYGIDYVIPAWATQKAGGSKRGVWGSIIGLVVGLFLFPPFGIIIGPFAGAIIGEMSTGKEFKDAFKSGFGSFVGFLMGTLLKLIVSGLMTWHFGKELFTG